MYGVEQAEISQDTILPWTGGNSTSNASSLISLGLWGSNINMSELLILVLVFLWVTCTLLPSLDDI